MCADVRRVFPDSFSCCAVGECLRWPSSAQMEGPGLQNWGADGRQREERLRRQNQEYLAAIRAQIEDQKVRRRRGRFEPEAEPPQRYRPPG